MEVYNQIGPGFGEAIYQEAMEIEVESREIPNNPQQEICLKYKEIKLKQFFKPDLICFDKIIVEIKSLSHLSSIEETQLLNYLKATGFPLGILINFGHENDLEWKRMAFTGSKSARKPGGFIPPQKPRINVPKPMEEDWRRLADEHSLL